MIFLPPAIAMKRKSTQKIRAGSDTLSIRNTKKEHKKISSAMKTKPYLNWNNPAEIQPAR